MHFFFFNDTATTEIYTLSLHDALPIFFTGSATARAHRVAGRHGGIRARVRRTDTAFDCAGGSNHAAAVDRSEEHTSELQSRLHLVCRLLLEKKKQQPTHRPQPSHYDYY